MILLFASVRMGLTAGEFLCCVFELLSERSIEGTIETNGWKHPSTSPQVIGSAEVHCACVIVGSEKRCEEVCTVWNAKPFHFEPPPVADVDAWQREKNVSLFSSLALLYC